MNRFFGAIFLISGTTIGAGMLALPVTTGMAGFVPALVLMGAIWLLMLLTAFYFLEVNLRVPGESNMISMVQKTLGRPGEVIAWITYLLLLYSLVAAYMAGCSEILLSIFDTFPPWAWALLVFVAFGALVYFGTSTVDFLNRILMIGLITSYVVILGLGLGHIKLSLLAHHDWPVLLSGTSVVLTAFGYHIIIPTLTSYLDHDARKLSWAILIGSFLPLLCYVLWQLLIMGIVPIDALSENMSHYLKHLSPFFAFATRLFSLFAIITSLLGVSLSLSDFLSDGLRIKKSTLGKCALILLTFVPPLLFVLFYPTGFITALNYAGLFVAILLAILPTLMVWSERYSSGHDPALIHTKFTVLGGKPLLVIAILLSFVLLCVVVII